MSLFLSSLIFSRHLFSLSSSLVFVSPLSTLPLYLCLRSSVLLCSRFSFLLLSLHSSVLSHNQLTFTSRFLSLFPLNYFFYSFLIICSSPLLLSFQISSYPLMYFFYVLLLPSVPFSFICPILLLTFLLSLLSFYASSLFTSKINDLS